MKSTIQDNINGRRMQPFAIFNLRGTCMKSNGNENDTRYLWYKDNLNMMEQVDLFLLLWK